MVVENLVYPLVEALSSSFCPNFCPKVRGIAVITHKSLSGKSIMREG
jgi:hypothetical protein